MLQDLAKKNFPDQFLEVRGDIFVQFIEVEQQKKKEASKQVIALFISFFLLKYQQLVSNWPLI